MPRIKTKPCNVCGETKPVSEFEKFARACQDCWGKRRRCSVCKAVKDITVFAKSARDRLGYGHTCPDCALRKYRSGDRTCATCGQTSDGLEFPKNSRECRECKGKRRRCRTCDAVKPMADFYHSAAGGIRRVCVECVSKRRREEWSSRERICVCCGEVKTSFNRFHQICTDCFGRYKRCGKCNQVLTVEMFYKDSSASTGFSCYCKPCIDSVRLEKLLQQPRSCRGCKRTLDRTLFEDPSDRFCIECRTSDSRQCSTCKEAKPLSEFSTAYNATVQDVESRCKACLAEQSERTSKSPRGRYSAAISGGKKAHCEFLISFEDYAELIKQSCHYCGHPLNETGSGLDRIDPSGDYTMDNVVPCCHPCNWTKSDYFSHSEMLEIGTAIGRVKSQREHVLNQAKEALPITQAPRTERSEP